MMMTEILKNVFPLEKSVFISRYRRSLPNGGDTINGASQTNPFCMSQNTPLEVLTYFS